MRRRPTRPPTPTRSASSARPSTTPSRRSRSDMTTATTASDRAVAAARDSSAIARSIAKPLGITVFIGALGYLVLEPLIRLQSKAFADGAQGYRTAFTRPGIGTTIITTVELALGSLAIALVLG